MTILFDAARPVKSTRRFGSGILAAPYVEPAPFPTFADEAWWAAERIRQHEARESAERAPRPVSRPLGVIRPAVAAAMARHTLVGHN